MNREDTAIMSFQEVYDAFQNDFHITPQKIVSMRNRNTHLKSTVESNSNSNTYSNYKSLDEEEFVCEDYTSNQIQHCSLLSHNHLASSNGRQTNNNSNNNPIQNEDEGNRKEKMSPYDIEFDVLGNSLYESLQDCFAKINPKQYNLLSGSGSTPVQQLVSVNYPLPTRFKFETSLDNIYITEDNFEQMEDEDKENKDPLEYPKQFKTIAVDATSNTTSPQQFSQEEQNEMYGEEEEEENQMNQGDAANQNDKQSPYHPFNQEHIIAEAEKLNANQAIFEEEEETRTESRNRMGGSKYQFSYQQRFEKNLMTPSQDHHNKHAHENINTNNILFADAMEVQVEEEEGIHHFNQLQVSNRNPNSNSNSINKITNNSTNYNSNNNDSNMNTLTPHQYSKDQSSEAQVVRFKRELKTEIIPYTVDSNSSSAGISSQNNYNYEANCNTNSNSNANNIYRQRQENRTQNNINNNNNMSMTKANYNYNSSSLYQHHLLQSASQSNRIIRNQQSSTNRTPLRDITSSSISSAKKNYQGVKKMLEFSSPMINSWDLKTAKKQKTESSKSKASGSSKKVLCTPAIFCR